MPLVKVSNEAPRWPVVQFLGVTIGFRPEAKAGPDDVRTLAIAVQPVRLTRRPDTLRLVELGDLSPLPAWSSTDIGCQGRCSWLRDAARWPPAALDPGGRCS